MVTQIDLPGVDAEAVSPEGDFLLLLTARGEERAAPSFFRDHREALLAAFQRYGAIYFRGFDLDSRAFEAVMDAIVPAPFKMLDVVTPRSHVRDTLYTSTQAHPDLDIVQHQEMSYHDEPPYCLGFYCEVAAARGGLTPVNDLRRIGRAARRLFPAVMDKFREVGVLFVRNFNRYNFKSWQTCWEATTHAEVEAKLRAGDTQWEWVDDSWLRTFQLRPAVLRDPVGQGEILYPSLNIFHHTFVRHIAGPQQVPVSSVEAEQPLIAYYGDRSPIPEEFLTWLRETSKAERVSVPWRARDFFLINNLIAGHGRTSYEGPRTVHASFRGCLHLQQLEAARR